MAIPRAFELDRRRVRETAVRRFSSERMAREYVEVYERVVREGVEKTGSGSTAVGEQE